MMLNSSWALGLSYRFGVGMVVSVHWYVYKLPSDSIGQPAVGLTIISTEFMLAVILIPHSYLAPNLSAQELFNGSLLD